MMKSYFKNSIMPLITLCVMLAVSFNAAATGSLRGDVSGDGIVNIADVTALIDQLLGDGMEVDPEASDVNRDGTINITDVTMLINQVMHSSKKVAHQSPESKTSLVKDGLLIDDEPVILEINPNLN